MRPWVVAVLAPLLATVIGFTVQSSVRAGEAHKQVEHNTEDIIRLDEQKAEKEKVDMTYDAVIRLEKKFDDYVNSH